MSCSKIKLCSGDLRTLIDIEFPTRVSDGRGGFRTTGWTSRGTSWAKAELMTMREQLLYQDLRTVFFRKFTLRYRSDVLITDRILLDSKAYNIRSLDDVDYYHEWLIIQAEAGVAD